MTGIYLRCDTCSATIGGEDVTQKARGIPTLRCGDGDRLREMAAGRGWQHTLKDRDKCPACALMARGRFVGRGKPNPVARSIVAMLLRQARTDYRNVLFARAKLAAEGPKYVNYVAQTTSVWCTSSGCAEVARRILYANGAQVD